MDKKKAAFGFLRFAGRFYSWAFRSIFRLVKKSDEHITAIEQKKRSANEPITSGVSGTSPSQR